MRSAKLPAKRSSIAVTSRFSSTGDLPERNCRKDAPPPRSPPLDGPAINANELGKPSHSRRCRSLAQNGDDKDGYGQIDLGSKKTQR
jgi:hypothetical protein